MNFEYFDSISPIQAREYLFYFLKEEKTAFERMTPEIEKDGIRVDYSWESLSPVFIWINDRLSIDQTTVSSSGSGDAIDFDSGSKILILRMSYYLGECFIKSCPELEWGIGDTETAVKNMPVITGFKKKMEMAPMLVCENLFLRIAGDRADARSTIDTAIKTWKSAV